MDTTDITPTHAAPITRSDIWFDDGNVVLQAERTQFKVHRGVLGANSSVFKDMFSMPQPPSFEGEVAVVGCPVVYLSDTAADATIVLQALFLRGHVVAGGPLPLAAVAAFLRLGKKYDIDPLHAEAIKRLRYEFPSTLDDFDKCSPGSMIIEEQGLYVSVKNLAREQSLLWALPLALYHCCRHYKPQDLVAGVKKNNGTTIALSPANLLRCFAACRDLGSVQYYTTLAGMTASTPEYTTCTSPLRCDEIRKSALYNVFIPFVDLIGLDSWSNFQADWLGDRINGMMCISCTEAGEELYNEGRASFYESLPSIFGLPGWDELRRE